MRDKDLIIVRNMCVDYAPMMYSANGHFSVGDYHDLFPGYKEVEAHNKQLIQSCMPKKFQYL